MYMKIVHEKQFYLNLLRGILIFQARFLDWIWQSLVFTWEHVVTMFGFEDLVRCWRRGRPLRPRCWRWWEQRRGSAVGCAGRWYGICRATGWSWHDRRPATSASPRATCERRPSRRSGRRIAECGFPLRKCWQSDGFERKCLVELSYWLLTAVNILCFCWIYWTVNIMLLI